MTNPRLSSLREMLSTLAIPGFVIPRADEHLGEYVPPGAERLAWLTGFTGSAGLAIVLAAEAAVFTDSRYTLQLAKETDASQFELLHVVNDEPPDWARQRVSRLGYDPWLMSRDGVIRYTEAGVEMVPLSPNPLDGVWLDRPVPPTAQVTRQDLEFTGQSSAEKRETVAAALRKAGQDACVLTDPPSVNWLLNIRGRDLEFVPVALGFAILHADATVDLFMSQDKLGPDIASWLGADVRCHPPEAFAPALAGFAGRSVRVDPAGSPVAVSQTLQAGGASVVDGPNPCLLPKACKNAIEQAGMCAAHARDAVALCRFLQWLQTAHGETERSAAARLLALRQEAPEFCGESFPAISGAGEHGAVIHYRVTPESDRSIRPNELYLSDSGGQYRDGTTDVTRTVWTGPGAPPAEVRARFTAVLRGHIALAMTVFPHGVAGLHLDAIARRALWMDGLDYDHGTGHGVGSYLSVHEGPVSLSRAATTVPLEAGMILSNEPGFYLPGQYGIRLENLLLVQAADRPAATKPYLRFETLTLAPFDRRLIDPALLQPEEREWLDAYHARVLATLEDGHSAPFADWLRAECAPLG